jgi:glycosyltransferase involved in cell wall biosynthesis
MKISIITPSFNHGRFIQDTIESVLDQKYDNFEHIIIDGGSTDNTLDIISSYKHIKWISEKDSGSASAINKGLNIADGDIISWLNSDDYYDSNVFQRIVEVLSNNTDINFIYGNQTFVNENKVVTLKDKTIPPDLDYLLNYSADIIRQSAIFFTKSLLNKVGNLDIRLKCVFDYDLFLRMIKIAHPFYINDNFAFVRDYPSTISRKYVRKQGIEIIKTSWKYGGNLTSRLVLNALYRKILFPNISKY